MSQLNTEKKEAASTTSFSAWDGKKQFSLKEVPTEFKGINVTTEMIEITEEIKEIKIAKTPPKPIKPRSPVQVPASDTLKDIQKKVDDKEADEKLRGKISPHDPLKATLLVKEDS